MHSPATLLGTPRFGEDNLLKFKPSNRMGKKGDLSDYERGMVVGARRAGLNIKKKKRRSTGICTHNHL